MKQALVQLGLTEREAEAYLALYHFKEVTATELAKVTKEHRTNIYDSLHGLIKKGLITYSVKNNVNYYHVSNPERLIDYVEEKEHLARTLLPQLTSRIKLQEEKPVVEIYGGSEGFKSILSIILREKQTIYGIGASEEWEKRFPLKLEQYMMEREKNNIRAKLLYVKGTKPVHNKMNEFRFLPTEFSNPSTIAIFGNYVATLMWTQPMVATLTKSKQLSHSFKKYFEVLWNLSSH